MRQVLGDKFSDAGGIAQKIHHELCIDLYKLMLRNVSDADPQLGSLASLLTKSSGQNDLLTIRGALVVLLLK